MKTHYRKSQLATLLIFAACSGFFLPIDVAAQPATTRPAATRSKKITPKAAPPRKEYVNWYVSYTVTIKGKGEIKGELQGEADIKWSVDRSFVGRMRLDGPTPRRFRGKAVDPEWETFENYGPTARPWTVNVKIKDRLEKVYEGPGEIGTHEDRTDVTVWEGDPTVSGPPEDLDALEVNKEKRTYFVILTVVPKSMDKNIRMSRFSIYDRSEAGYGGKPTHEVTKPLEDQIAIRDIPMPKGDHLESFRKNSWISTGKTGAGELTLPPTYPYTIEFPRTCFPPQAPFFEGIPETQTKVEICVEILLSKIPH